jgi:hypothetical protein
MSWNAPLFPIVENADHAEFAVLEEQRPADAVDPAKRLLVGFLGQHHDRFGARVRLGVPRAAIQKGRLEHREEVRGRQPRPEVLRLHAFVRAREGAAGLVHDDFAVGYFRGVHRSRIAVREHVGSEGLVVLLERLIRIPAVDRR